MLHLTMRLAIGHSKNKNLHELVKPNYIIKKEQGKYAKPYEKQQIKF